MYQLTSSGTSVIRLSDGATIPLPPNESEGFAYQQWLDAGNKPLPAPTITMQQLVAQVLAEVRVQRVPIMRTLDGLQSTANSEGLAALIAGDSVTATAKRDASANIEKAKQGLRDATNLDLTPYGTYEEMRQAFKAYYANLVQGASPDVVLAFRASA